MQREDQDRAQFTRRSALTLAGAAGVAAVGVKAAAAAVPPPGGIAGAAPTGRTLDSHFDEAAARYGVPRDVLAAIGYNESRFDNHGGTASVCNGYGIMHLADNPTNRTLAEAGRLTGLSADQLAGDDACNVLGAAAVLKARADSLGIPASSRADVAAWAPVIASYPALADTTTTDLYTQGAYMALQSGASAGGVQIAAQDVPQQYSSTGAALAADPANAAAIAGPPAGQLPTALPDPATAAAAGPPAGQLPTALPDPVVPTPVPQAGPARPAPTVLWSPAYSGNYRKANRPTSGPIRYIVIHTTQGSYASAISWFKNARARVSAHYVIRSSDGQITQTVADSHVAWHAGNSQYNAESIGIEHEGYINNSAWYTEAMYRSSAWLVAQLCAKYGIPRTRSRILGHSQVPRATHTDPGRHWNWTKYMNYVEEAARAQTPATAAPVANSGWSTEFTLAASANWMTGATNASKHNADYRYAAPAPVTDTAWFSGTLPSAGTYRVDVWYPAGAIYNSATPYVVATTSGNKFVTIDQRSGGGAWRTIGTFSLPAGSGRIVGVSRWSKAPGYVIADAARVTKVG